MLSRIDRQRKFFMNQLGLTGDQVASKSVSDLEQEYYQAQAESAGSAGIVDKLLNRGPRPGEWVSTLGASFGNAALTRARVYYVPILFSTVEDIPLSEMAVEVAGAGLGSAGSIVRLGLFENDANDLPKNKLVEFTPTIDTASAGIKPTVITNPFTALKNIWYHVAFSVQISAVPTFKCVLGQSIHALSNVAMSTQSVRSRIEDPVEGPLPDVANSLPWATTVPRIQFRRAA